MTRQIAQFAILALLLLAVGELARPKGHESAEQPDNAVLSLVQIPGGSLQTGAEIMESLAFAPTATPEPTATPPPPPPEPTATAVPQRPAASAPSTSRPAPTPTSQPARQNGAAPAGLGGRIFSQHNTARAAGGLGALTVDTALSAVAQQRAQDMANLRYFAHTSPSGQTAFTLLADAGYKFKTAAENIGMTTYPEPQAVGWVMNSWLNSPSHRNNIMNPEINRIGIGVAVSGDTFYFVTVFSD